jgi:hypothetical protein
VAGPSADPLRELDEDPLRAADVAEPIDVFVVLHLANELPPRARMLATTTSMSSTANVRWRMPGVFARACGSPPAPDGACNFASSIRPWPSGVSNIAISARTPLEPHDAVHPNALDRRLALQLESKLDEELRRGREVVDHDARREA